MQPYLILLLILLATGLNLAAEAVTTVSSVDLNRYLGTWYQIAYFPTKFQPNNGGLVTANYSLLKNGKIKVVNTSYKDDEGKVIRKQATATAWTVSKNNSKLKVRFFWPFTGDYWIVKLDQKGYSYTVVSDPKREYLWILSRDKAMDKAVYGEITDFLRKGGWNLNKLALTGKLK